MAVETSEYGSRRIVTEEAGKSEIPSLSGEYIPTEAIMAVKIGAEAVYDAFEDAEMPVFAGVRRGATNPLIRHSSAPHISIGH
jgi:hypothetical protein